MSRSMPAGPKALVVCAVVLASIALGMVVGLLLRGDRPVLALLTPVLLVPIAVSIWPRLGLYLLFALAVVIEQFPYEVGPRAGAVTSAIPAFQGAIKPVEALAVLTILVVGARSFLGLGPSFRLSPTGRALLAVLGVVGLYLFVGAARGGDPSQGLWEVRGLIYLAATFFLASALVRDMVDVCPLAWILVLGCAAKAAYGLVIFFDVRNLQPRPEAVLAHEESFFFGVYVIMTLGLWLFGIRSRLRLVATCLLPVVLLGDMVNSRRTAWVILFIGIAVLCLLGFVRVGERRRALAVAFACVAVFGSIYLPVFWDRSGSTAQPARAIRSIVAPDQRDESSNEYREIEDYNLERLIGESQNLGSGFGRPINYVGLVDLTEESPILTYVPHNGILHLWLRTGIVGMTVFVVFLMQAVYSAVGLSGVRRRSMGAVGAVTAGSVFIYVVMGAVDMGFFWLRNGLAIGVILGVMEGLAVRRPITSVDTSLLPTGPRQLSREAS